MAFAAFLNPVNQLAFDIALPAIDGELEFGRRFFAQRLSITQRRLAINFRLTHAQHVEVGPVQDEDRQLFTHRARTPGYFLGASLGAARASVRADLSCS